MTFAEATFDHEPPLALKKKGDKHRGVIACVKCNIKRSADLVHNLRIAYALEAGVAHHGDN